MMTAPRERSLDLFVRPFRAVAAQGRVVHLVARVLGELHVQAVFAQAKDIDAVLAQCLGNLHPELG